MLQYPNMILTFDQIQKLYDRGMMIIAGMIVGFDNDGHDIFERQYEFTTQAAIPIVTLGSLVAPAATPLHDRLAAEGRLVADGSEGAAMPWSTNIGSIWPGSSARAGIPRGRSSTAGARSSAD